MSQYVVFLLLGLGSGAVFGALALALVLTFRSSGVVNFATGATALYSAYTYAFLRQGELLVPLPGVPKTVGLGGPLGLFPAMAISSSSPPCWGWSCTGWSSGRCAPHRRWRRPSRRSG